MARLLRTLIAAFMLVGTAAAGTPEWMSSHADPPPAVAAAVRWIAENSTYAPKPLRNWVALRAEDMPARARSLHVADDPRVVYGMYSCATDTLYFRRDVDFNDPVVFSFLVHEVTHHLQCASGRSGIDLCAWEREAYGLQGAYLRSVIKAGEKDGKRLTKAQLAAARATEADLGRRTDIACTDLRRPG